MQAHSTEHQPLENSYPILGRASGLMDGNTVTEEMVRPGEPTYFRSHYKSCMEMYADAATVAAYLDAHHGWFVRCAHPMMAHPLGQNGYALTVGKFGSFGYEVEPKIGLDLLPQDQGIYRIQTIPIPGYDSPGYEVDFRAAMHLVESEQETLSLDDDGTAPIETMTRVEWELDLEVAIQFPRFIQALPKSLIQSTGDRLLVQIVRQVSKRLTVKVQEDFHAAHSLSCKKRKKNLWNRGHAEHD